MPLPKPTEQVVRHVAYLLVRGQSVRSEPGTGTARRERDRLSAAQVPGLTHLPHSATPHNESGLGPRGQSAAREASPAPPHGLRPAPHGCAGTSPTCGRWEWRPPPAAQVLEVRKQPPFVPPLLTRLLAQQLHQLRVPAHPLQPLPSLAEDWRAPAGVVIRLDEVVDVAAVSMVPSKRRPASGCTSTAATSPRASSSSAAPQCTPA